MVEVDVDVLIAGGSVAGIATAAALREFGWSVLIVEPGQRTDRRLAGELIHPSGVAGLVELGLYDPAAFAGAVPIEGFVVFPDEGEDSERVTLCYPPDAACGSRAIALDYGRLRTNLQAAVRRLDHVTFMDGARVSGIATDELDRPKVTIEVGGETRVVTCRMVVAADGASSTMRSLAGIEHTRRNISTIAGYVVENAPLPAPSFGHVFIGGDAVVLVYQISETRARIMFDQPIDRDGIPAAQHRAKLLESLPADLRDAADHLVHLRQLTAVTLHLDMHLAHVAFGHHRPFGAGPWHVLVAHDLILGERSNWRRVITLGSQVIKIDHKCMICIISSSCI